MVAQGIGADVANIGVRNVVANAAIFHLVAQLDQTLGKTMSGGIVPRKKIPTRHVLIIWMDIALLAWDFIVKVECGNDIPQLAKFAPRGRYCAARRRNLKRKCTQKSLEKAIFAT